MVQAAERASVTRTSVDEAAFSLVHNMLSSGPAVTTPPSADVIRDDKVHQYHRIDSVNILIYLALLSLTIVTVWVFKHRRVRFLHETGLAIIYGILVGCTIKYLSPSAEVSHLAVVPSNSTTANSSAWYANGPPDSLWLRVPVPDRTPGSPTGQYTNKTFDYAFQGEVVNVGHFGGGKELQERATFDPEIFFNIVLPPIIFNAGFGMKHKFFFQNIGAVLTFALLGTALAALVVGAITFAFTRLMTTLAMTFVDCLFFGAVISSTDPVTVLAIFNDLNVDGMLHALVFGEAILNDAVSVVMSSTVTRFAETSQSDTGLILSLLGAVGYFFGIFLGSLSLGCLIGCSTALLTKFTHLRDYPMLETTLFIVMSYASYNLAEALDFIGIVAVLFCGVCQAHYTFNNLSAESKLMTKQFFGLLSFVAENFIFCYIGVSLFTFQKHHWDISFILCSSLAVIISRIVSVYPLSALLNLGRKHKIPINYQHMLFFSGLRGAIAFALSIRNTVSTARRVIATTTCVIVMFTVVVCGGSTSQLLQWLRIPTGVNESSRAPAAGVATVTDSGADAERRKRDRAAGRRSSYEALESARNVVVRDDGVQSPFTSDTSIAEQQAQELTERLNDSRLRERSWGARVWRNFDDLFLKPILTHYRPSLVETCPGICLPLAKLVSSKQQIEHAERLFDVDDDDDGDNGAVLQPDRGPFVVVSNDSGRNYAVRNGGVAKTMSQIMTNGSVAERSASSSSNGSVVQTQPVSP